MAAPTSLSHELIRAAAAIGFIHGSERIRLVKAAADAITAGRRQVAYSGKRRGWDAEVPTFTLRLMSLNINTHKDSAVAEALLDAAKVLRDLRLILASPAATVPAKRSQTSDAAANRRVL